ncbi:acetyl-CoA carboxylase biotin carboxylase subunit [Petrocella sp. FN5]|uniref:acetyl-CoA carboxylase biotin carboxylase subunit n=1 Tax=Petrocella sp. FN5 TaxID=3032002 RepID=UPI0023DB6ACC|nr:acetyl-CoA carboxylase biotin carboxylase subunit [Petrocella sp. FN5]MDF1617442.1 acetyl-CoA carboxylase biotin carboxylase subunit [Petrocella sp. FN5]
MFEKILIANRGEIAVRIIRACREMGIKSVAVYSEADKEALHTQLADEAICIGPANSRESYLDITRVISAAVITKANAIHPGFGFLSENPTFAHACEDSNIILIGPSSEMIEAMGNKSRARKTMIEAGIPVVPGSDGIVKSIIEAKKIANDIGYPMIVKASSGGGGKGMRIILNEGELEKNFIMAQKEAKASFDDDAMYMERYIVNPSHIEFQILADNYGNTVHLGERDCSIQRRHQKIVEEAPSSKITPKLRKTMGDIAVKAAKSINYRNAGTVEFLLEDSGEFFFMEMNTRIQVEHPITEMITGIDLIKKQIEIAGGKPLNLKQKDIVLKGHSIECRINAENPSKGFRPSPGTIDYLHMPGGHGIRIDSAIYNGYAVPPLYDSMLAKLIVHGDTREDAIRKMNSALGEFVVSGIDTNIDFHMEIINQPDFISGNYNTSFIENIQGDKFVK